MQTLTVSLTDPLVEPLLQALAEEYESRYGSRDEMAYAKTEEFEPPDGVFVVVVEDGRTVAGGGFRRIDRTTCELKRMWTADAHRRRGLASSVLSTLEERAAAQGYTRILLETGPAQPEAIGLYTARGYRQVPDFGRYDESVSFERLLSA